MIATATPPSTAKPAPRESVGAGKPPATPPVPGNSRSEPTLRTFATPAEREAAVVREVFLPSCLCQILNDMNAGSAGTLLAFEAMMAEATSSKDPIERMLVEQMILLHYRLATLQVEAAEVRGSELVKAYNGALARLLGEFRRLTLALRMYRAPVSAKAFTVVHQQNVATAGGNQQVEYSQDGKQQEKLEKNSFSAQAELDSNDEENLHELRERISRGEKPQARGRGADEHSSPAAMVA